jgi:hypothetical protein
MLVKFAFNIGTADAKRLSIDHKGCREGMTCEVDAKAGEWLLANNLATDVTPPKPKAPKVEPKPEPKPEPTPVAKPAETQKPTK